MKNSQQFYVFSLAVFELARFYGLECSLFERLVKNDFPFVTLETQHRMHPVMTQHIVRPYFYNRLDLFAHLIFYFPHEISIYKSEVRLEICIIVTINCVGTYACSLLCAF